MPSILPGRRHGNAHPRRGIYRAGQTWLRVLLGTAIILILFATIWLLIEEIASYLAS